jgi:hypothetical protein
MRKNSDLAREIYQELLDQIGTAIRERDRSEYIRHFCLPHRVQTFDSSLVVETEETLGTYFDRMIERLASLGVPELTRYCTVAEFKDSDTIQGFHHTKLINRDLMIVEDYTALSVLKRVADRWKVSESQYAEDGPSIPTRITE